MNDISRFDKLKGINLSYAVANNNQVSEMYNIFVKDIICKEKKVLKRQIMVEHVLSNIQVADDATVGDLYNYAHANNLLVDTGIKYIKIDMKKKKENNNNILHNIVLNVVNDLLEIMEKEKIENLEEFKNINRDDLLQDKCKKVIENNEVYILDKYKKSEIRYYQKERLGTYVISVLKGMIGKLDGYEFTSKNHKNQKITKKSKKTNYTSYCIKKL
jgi:hypothetical protein